MPAPSKAFTVIADTDVDPDSPITTGLMTAFRDNDIHLEEWLGMDYTAAQNHDHNGTNSKLVSITGANLALSLSYEIYDHFTEGALNNELWATQTTVAITTNQHYLTFGSGSTSGSLISNFTFQLEQVRAIFEARIKVTPTATDFNFGSCGVSGTTRGADFLDEPTADEIRCQTRGSGGTQNDDNNAVGGGGVDAWHVYKIDLTDQTATKFYLDGTLIATNSTAVPDAQDLNVKLSGGGSGGGNTMKVDYIKFYAASVVDSTA